MWFLYVLSGTTETHDQVGCMRMRIDQTLPLVCDVLWNHSWNWSIYCLLKWVVEIGDADNFQKSHNMRISRQEVVLAFKNLSKSLQPQKNLHKLRWWWGLERLLTGFHWVPCLDTRPNPKMATNLWCKFPPPTKKHIAPEKWCNRKMNFPNFFPILGCIQITVFRGLFRPLVSWRVDPILQTFETSKAWGFRAVDFPPRGWHFCLIMVMEKTYPQCLWESPQTPVSIWATD